MGDGAYLKRELEHLVQSDISIFEFLQSGSLDGIWYLDLEDLEKEWMSPRFWELMGYDPSEMKHLASEWQDKVFTEDLAPALENLQKHLEDPNHPYSTVVRYKHKDGSTVWVRCRGIAIRDEHGKPIRMLGAHNDLTEIMNAKQEIEKLNQELLYVANRDFLTGLYNRRAFEEQYYQMIELAKREGSQISIAMFDIDNFKSINDTYGHDKGDDVLKQVANTLLDIGRKSDIIGRYGGEEFIMLMPLRTNQDEAVSAAERIRLAIENYSLKDTGNLTISAGVATIIPQPNGDTKTISNALLREADEALYFVKKHGRNKVVHFNFLKTD